MEFFIFLILLFFSSLKKNPLTANKRITDIDFGASSATVLHIEIALQNTINVEELMKPTYIRNEDSTIKFLYKNNINNDIIYIDSDFSINKSIFDKDEYEVLKTFFSNLYGFIGKPIILKRN